MISGFTVARNVVDLAYPLIESVLSALPICDEFIISEGYSTDRTWEAVQALADRFPDKIRVRRDRWPDTPDDGRVIAAISNLALAECRSPYCLYLQANEVLHENALALVSSLPPRNPGTTIFSLPFYSLLGPETLWLVQQRNRLFQNRVGIGVAGDGYDVGYAQGGNPPGGIPYRLSRRWQNLQIRLNHVPPGVFRYRALCPANYLRKISVRRAMTSQDVLLRQWDREEAAAKAAAERAGNDPKRFWKLMTPFFDARCMEQGDLDVRMKRSRVVPLKGKGPAIMAGLGDTWEYSFEDSLQRLAA